MYNKNWDALINWYQIERTVFEIQHRMYMALKVGNIVEARNLQTMLSIQSLNS